MAINSQQGSALQFSLLKSDGLQEVVLKTRPSKPVYVLYPELIKKSAQDFVASFPGKSLYAVKTNPDPQVIKAVWAGGIRAFDVASLPEIELVKGLFPKAKLHFMHTIKAPEAIRAAYFDHGVRHFVLDHEEELFKIMRETDLAQDLDLTVRVALLKNDKAQIDFSSKFGANLEEAIELLKKCRPVSKKLGLSFHVGTQTTDSKMYAKAISYCANIIKSSGIKVDVLNVGGGFPVAYEGDENISTLSDCIDVIKSELKKHSLDSLSLIAEPGRVLVARGAKLVARVELRKGDFLYINDGVYGGLFDAAKWLNTRYPVSAISCDRPFNGEYQEFRLAGPTCDSLDIMNGPFILPADIGIGDWIVFENTGAYSQALRSDFNGFGHADVITITSGYKIR